MRRAQELEVWSSKKTAAFRGNSHTSKRPPAAWQWQAPSCCRARILSEINFCRHLMHWCVLLMNHIDGLPECSRARAEAVLKRRIMTLTGTIVCARQHPGFEDLSSEPSNGRRYQFSRQYNFDQGNQSSQDGSAASSKHRYPQSGCL